MEIALQKINRTASMREVQRNYFSLFSWVSETKQPLILTSGSKPSVIVLDIDMYQYLVEQLQKRQFTEAMSKRESKWNKIEAGIKLLRHKGKQNISLSDFIIQDRERH